MLMKRQPWLPGQCRWSCTVRDCVVTPVAVVVRAGQGVQGTCKGRKANIIAFQTAETSGNVG